MRAAEAWRFGVKNMRHHALPVLAVSAFLAIAGVYHLLAPAQSERVFSKSGPVRLVGAALSVGFHE